MSGDTHRWVEMLRRYLHDPPHKVFAIKGRKKQKEKDEDGGHEKDADCIANAAGLPNKPISHNKQAWEAADHFASALERVTGAKSKKDFDYLKSAWVVLPLGGTGIEVPIPEKVQEDWDNWRDAFRGFYSETCRRIRNGCWRESAPQVEQEWKKVFWNVWRWLVEAGYLGYREDQHKEDWQYFLARYGELLPAYTVAPDHSIWEHLKVTSAVGVENRKIKVSLIKVGLRGVQEFIRQARKTHDLWAGSWLFSYLTFRMIAEFADKYGPTVLIYPDLLRQPLVDWWFSTKQGVLLTPEQVGFKGNIRWLDQEHLLLATIPNQFMMLVPENDNRKLTEFCEKVVCDLPNWVVEIAEKVWDEFGFRLTEFEKQQLRAAFTAVWSLFSLPAMEPKQKATEEVHKTARCLGRRMQCWERMLKVVNEIKRNGKDQIAGPLFGTMRQLGRHYGLMVDALNALFDSAKVSDMREPLSEQVGAKCRICGIRSAVIAGPDLLGKENSLETLTLKKVLCDETEALKRIRAAFEAYGKQSPDCCQDAEITQKLTPRYIHPKEALCAVCFLKRALDVWVCKEVLGNSKQDQQIGFPSTAEVATSNVKEVVCNTNLLQRLRDALKRILSSAEKNLLHGSQPLPRIQSKCGITYDANIDGEWLFESEWRKEKLEQEYGIMRVRKDAFVDVLGNVEEKDEERRRGLLRLIREQAEKAGEKLTAYYAVVMADGDEMGKWISGAKGPDWKEVFHPQVWKEIEGGGLDKKLRELFPHRPLTPAIHAAISTGLRNFALELVPRILEQQYLGKVVYAGGDDLLAFLNLRDLLPAIHLLRLAYSGMIKCERQQIHPAPSNRSGFVEIDGRYLPTMGPNATLSVGVCIAHYKAPLRLALAAARRSLDILAKQNAGRDAVGFCVLKHSGETVEVGAKWWVSCDFCGSRFELLPSLGQLCNSMRQEQPMYVSDTFITGLQEEFGAFKAQGLPVEAVQREIRRLVQRAVNATPQTERQKKQEFAERVASLVTGFYCCASRKDWDSFISLLRLAQFLVREGAKWTLNSGS